MIGNEWRLKIQTMFVKGNLNIEQEFGKFFVENYPKVKNFARQILASEEDAEDVAQDVFLKLADKPEVWRDEEMINNYLFKMTKNHIFNCIKHKNIERKYQEELVRKNQLSEEFGLDDKLHAKEIELVITGLVAQMPQRRKEIFIMSRYEGKANQRIAELLNMSVRTVERHLYLALSDLKKTLNIYLPIE
jgi:RNA polymerase sigma-70 factor (ECF subfamily)